MEAAFKRRVPDKGLLRIWDEISINLGFELSWMDGASDQGLLLCSCCPQN